MKPIPFEIGRIAISKQGHDKGSWLVVVGLVDQQYVLVADGKNRKLEKPKKKQTKHLRAKPYLAEDIAEMIELGRPLLDSDIRKAIQAALQKEPTEKQQDRNLTKQKEECALVQE